MMRRGVLAILGLVAAAPALAQGGGDAAVGHGLAQAWCASCHTIAPGETAKADSVPSFAAIAARPGVTADALRTFLADPHGRMPKLSLSRAEIDNLAAYILTQRR